MGFKLEGKRVILQVLKESDVSCIVEITNDRDVLRFMSLPCPFTLRNARDLVDESRISFKNGSGYDFGIFLKESKELVGVVRLMSIDQTNQNAEIGYWIGKDYQGNGYSRDALKLVLDFGFKRLRLFRISAKVMHLNVVSINLVKKFGFRQEGRLRKAILKDRNWFDGLIYGLLKEDYRREVAV